MKIIDTYSHILTAFDGGNFSLEKWRGYIDSSCPGLSELCIADMQECLAAGNVSFEKDYLPVLNAVAKDIKRRELAHESFCRAALGLEDRIAERFGRCPAVNIVFYLGLCCGAGWVTNFNGVTTVLLGVEKIIELDGMKLADNFDSMLKVFENDGISEMYWSPDVDYSECVFL